MKAEIPSPLRAKDIKELESILTDWKFKFTISSQFDDKFQLTDDTRKTILMKTLHRDYAKVMREQYEKQETYESFESQLFIETAAREMEDECHGNNCRTLQAVTEDAEYPAHTAYPEDYS